MPKKTKSSAPTPATSPIGSSDPTTPTRRDSLHSDPTMQLHMDDLQIEAPDASPPIDAGETQLLSEQNLRDAAHQDLLDEASTTTSFDIPVEMIEPLEEREAARWGAQGLPASNQIPVHDPFQTRKAAAVVDQSALKAHERRVRTIKMNAAQGRSEPAPQPPSSFAETASRIDITELRDIDADGFHVFILRPDHEGRVYLPRAIFGEHGSPEGELVLLKAKILHQ